MKDEELEWISSSWIGSVRDNKKRMSSAVYRKWIVGDIDIPSPINDRIGLKYGNVIKEKVATWLRRELAVKDEVYQRQRPPTLSADVVRTAGGCHQPCIRRTAGHCNARHQRTN